MRCLFFHREASKKKSFYLSGLNLRSKANLSRFPLSPHLQRPRLTPTSISHWLMLPFSSQPPLRGQCLTSLSSFHLRRQRLTFLSVFGTCSKANLLCFIWFLICGMHVLAATSTIGEVFTRLALVACVGGYQSYKSKTRWSRKSEQKNCRKAEKKLTGYCTTRVYRLYQKSSKQSPQVAITTTLSWPC